MEFSLGRRERLGLRRLLVIAVVLPAASAAGCAQDSPRPDATYAEPAWMAEVRAQKEEFGNAYLACLAEHGVTGSVSLDGHVLIDTPVGPDGQVAAGLQEANIAAGEACNDEVPWLPEPDAAEDYARMLDVRKCLIDQGFTVPEPPSREVWIESTNSMTSMPWTPYAALLDIESDHYVDLSDEELTKVFDACQQNYYGQYTVAVP